ncbi:helix-turn-helix domain-containing protein [Pseudomonas sp. BMS12]|uniref:helix-turn-helix domain-containing protein n=1 Tax=Pseudomonas sp. BMS12 TaxID=1796033 RepID=UPI00083A77B8|nr:helix-turn-helix domain-containing protein [Pseudomonas sp. BMS12]
MKEMDIGQVARWSGLPASTLRYYEEKGLIRSIGRNGLRRVFNETVLQRLALIALGRSAGFNLEDIAGMLGNDGTPAIDRERLRQRADEVDRRIRQLSSIRDGLRHAADCPEENHLQCAKFQRLMGLASKASGKHRARTPPAD